MPKSESMTNGGGGIGKGLDESSLAILTLVFVACTFSVLLIFYLQSLILAKTKL
jgi:hypothetical protein